MPPKDDPPGLLSKVVKFVRNPSTSWGDLGKPEPDLESSYSKQLLKEMIERKRRNDFVRKREFDMLRKMRRNEVVAGHDLNAGPSFFQSSMPSRPDDRASTLKKIDEIEAQMSMQWWKNKQGESGLSSGGSGFATPISSHLPLGRSAAPKPAPPPVSKTYRSTGPAPLVADTKAVPSEPVTTAPSGLGPARPFAPAPVIAPPHVSAPAPAPWRPAAPEVGAATSPSPPSKPGADSSINFSASRQFAIDIDEIAHDPEIEEVSMRFASGDDTGAETGLLALVGPKGTRIGHEETWLTLFDLYRATGQKDRFENAAIDFADRFQRSAPQWFSMPEAVGHVNLPPATAPVAGAPVADWTAPSSVGTQSLVVLGRALTKAPQPWRLNWTKLVTIEGAALAGLSRLFADWAAQPVKLRFIGDEKLTKVLVDATPPGDKEVDPAWWSLRMEVLRVMRREEEFELVALDYCVTYEVSPPSWERPRCEYKPLLPDGSEAGSRAGTGDSVPASTTGTVSGYGDTEPLSTNSQLPPVATAELTGQIVDDATEVLDKMERRLLGAEAMVVNCARLIRIDFSAAGTLLNWVTAQQAGGFEVRFVDVHRLVAAFFHVIGISEHAQVHVRTD